MNVVQKMEALADEWHCGVERKGKGHVPYIAHPRAVVDQLKAWGMTEEANPVPLASMESRCSRVSFISRSAVPSIHPPKTTTTRTVSTWNGWPARHRRRS